MKKYLYFSLIILAFSCVSCNEKEKSVNPELPVEPLMLLEYTWVNNSSHSMTFSIGDYDDYTLLPGESFVYQCDGMYFEDLFSDYGGLTFVFNNGQYGYAHTAYEKEQLEAGEPLYKGDPYFDESLYEYSVREVEYPSKIVRIPCWKYTFTDADYDAAVERGEFNPAYFHYLCYRNEGSRDLTLSMRGSSKPFENVSIPVGGEYTQRYLRSSLGSPNPGGLVGYEFTIAYEDGVTREIEMMHSVDQYNLRNCDRYTKSKTEEGSDFWTYTFTDGDYDEAVRLAGK